ncbi:hypothetical protein A4A49_58979 [Nicotiana attenuata]|uniref:Uncharacterized protein n=1 Tax=Nicotiana attenuata TaxID=49451 RepID=A0A1J6KM60_NICAT|nr:hypothetical protein A4A49_58979 [Nicotiana attenuata]
MKGYKVKTAKTHQVLARRSWKSLLQLSPSPACNNVIWYMSHSLAKDEIWSLELQACFSPSHKAEMYHILARMLQSGDMARRSSSLRNTLYVSRQAARRDVPSCFCTLLKTCKIRKDFGALGANKMTFLQIQHK